MKKAFSLLEIMIVIVIIGLLAGVVGTNVNKYLIKARQNTARQEIGIIVNALEAFKMENNRYPTNEEGIEILAEASESDGEPFLKSIPVDPWSNAYQYNCPGTDSAYEVISFGGDGREGGDGEDLDLSSEDVEEAND